MRPTPAPRRRHHDTRGASRWGAWDPGGRAGVEGWAMGWWAGMPRASARRLAPARHGTALQLCAREIHSSSMQAPSEGLAALAAPLPFTQPTTAPPHNAADRPTPHSGTGTHTRERSVNLHTARSPPSLPGDGLAAAAGRARPHRSTHPRAHAQPRVRPCGRSSQCVFPRAQGRARALLRGRNTGRRRGGVGRAAGRVGTRATTARTGTDTHTGARTLRAPWERTDPPPGGWGVCPPQPPGGRPQLL